MQDLYVFKTVYFEVSVLSFRRRRSVEHTIVFFDFVNQPPVFVLKIYFGKCEQSTHTCKRVILKSLIALSSAEQIFVLNNMTYYDIPFSDIHVKFLK